MRGLWVLGPIARWLRQKLPNAIVVQDQELEVDRDIFDIHNYGLNSDISKYKFFRKNWFSCRRVGEFASLSSNFGCVAAAVQRLFLLWELMQVLGPQTLSFQEILQLLEGIGVNTRTCEPRILRILEGKLPGGVVPAEEDFMLLGQESRQNPDWEAILADRFSLKMSHGVIA